jgi:hypothetical protein
MLTRPFPEQKAFHSIDLKQMGAVRLLIYLTNGRSFRFYVSRTALMVIYLCESTFLMLNILSFCVIASEEEFICKIKPLKPTFYS